MKQTNINQLTAAKTTVAYCENTAADTATITNFAPTVGVVKGKIVIVESFNMIGDTPTKGVTLNANALRETMVQHAFLLGNALVAFGGSQSPPDFDLMKQANLPKSYFDNLNKQDCLTECQRIHGLAVDNAADIADFGAGATDITDAGNAVNLFALGIEDSRAAVIKRSDAKKQSGLTLKNVNNMLKTQLDPMANTLRYKNNSWWTQYRLSREVIDLGKTFTKLRATVTDENGNPLKGVLVSLLQAGVDVYSKKTNLEGKVSIIKIKPGDYDIKAEKSGFITVTETEVHFAPGSEKIHEITLVSGTGNTVNREGTLPSPGIAEINLDGVHGNNSSTITIVLSAMLRVYAAANSTDPPGSTFVDVPAGTTTYNLDNFAALVGFDSIKTHLLIQNIGMSAVTYKFTFENV